MFVVGLLKKVEEWLWVQINLKYYLVRISFGFFKRTS